jgi:hypothetical protein
MPRRLTLLAAAAIGIGMIGIGSLLGGAVRPRDTVPTAPLAAVKSPESTTPTSLPTLDDFIAAGSGSVLVAQAHDPILGSRSEIPLPPGDRSGVALGEMWARGEYRIAITCLGESSIEYDVRTAPGSSPGFVIACDGSIVERTFTVGSPAHFVLFYDEPTSWRVVVHGELAALPLPTGNPFIPPADPALEELSRTDDQIMSQGDSPGPPGMRIREMSPVTGRPDYAARLWCPFGDTVRMIFGSQTGGALTADTDTVIACNGLIRDLDFRMARPSGSQVFIVAPPETRWALLITSEKPPVSLAEDVPGWQQVGAFGPDLAFVTTPISFTGIGAEGGSEVQVSLACTGTEPIEVTVDGGVVPGKIEMFTASCQGSTASATFMTSGEGARVAYTAPAGIWTALTVQVPDASTAPGP